MKISNSISDDAVFEEIGRRIARSRVDRGLSQAKLAREAGVSFNSVRRLEYGESVKLITLVRILRVLDQLDNLQMLLPEATEIRPSDLLELQGRKRKRSSVKSRKPAIARPLPWKDEE